MLERISDYFYDPVLFWAAPFALVMLQAGYHRVRAWIRHRRRPPTVHD